MTRDQISQMVDTLINATETTIVDAAGVMLRRANACKIVKSVYAQTLPLFFAYGGGRNRISNWPYKTNPKNQGRGRWDNASHAHEDYTELSAPIHPFQLNWTTADDHAASASFRNPTGLVVS